MGGARLEDLIAACGGTKALVARQGALEEAPALLQKTCGARRAFVVADENTMAAAGEETIRALLRGGAEIAGTLVFPATPELHAEYDRALEARDAIARALAEGGCVPLSVGSGTVNDIVKFAASALSLPYVCVATAASVDGYTSFGAALVKDGFKQTLSCEAPVCVVADLDVLALAPERLSSSGFADLAGKITAGSDWIVADFAANFGAPGADRIEPVAWAMAQDGLRDYLKLSEGAARGDRRALQALFEALSVTGLAMQHARNSRPVSGAEHLFAHVWEMENLSFRGLAVTHGHKVALGTLATTAFTEELFADRNGPPPPPGAYRRPVRAERRVEARAAFEGSPALAAVLATAGEKFDDNGARDKIRAAVGREWKALREKVMDQMMEYSKLRDALAAAGCPTLPEQIGLSRAEAIAAARRAQMIRVRYNSLDLAWDLGCFETTLERVGASGKYLREA